MAPLRFDTGTAGGLLTKRSPAGIFYRERVGWYLGSDLQGREVFVRIRATQALRSLDPEGRRLATDGSWGVTTNAWLLRERKRLSWSGNTRADESGSSAASAREEVRTIPMPDLFIWCLMGVPSGPRMSIYIFPPGCTSISHTGFVNPFGPHHCARRWEVVHTFHTRDRDAGRMRVRVSSFSIVFVMNFSFHHMQILSVL